MTKRPFETPLLAPMTMPILTSLGQFEIFRNRPDMTQFKDGVSMHVNDVSELSHLRLENARLAERVSQLESEGLIMERNIGTFERENVRLREALTDAIDGLALAADALANCVEVGCVPTMGERNSAQSYFDDARDALAASARQASGAVMESGNPADCKSDAKAEGVRFTPAPPQSESDYEALHAQGYAPPPPGTACGQCGWVWPTKSTELPCCLEQIAKCGCAYVGPGYGETTCPHGNRIGYQGPSYATPDRGAK